jgi:hypothetical protein
MKEERRRMKNREDGSAASRMIHPSSYHLHPSQVWRWTEAIREDDQGEEAPSL